MMGGSLLQDSSTSGFTGHDESVRDIDYAFDKLTSPRVLRRMAFGSKRVDRLLLLYKSKSKSKKGRKLRALKATLLKLRYDIFELFTLLKRLEAKDAAAERAMSVSLARKIIVCWERAENAITPPEKIPVSQLSVGSPDTPRSVPCAWLFDFDWVDKAHQEVLSLRKKFSNFLDDTYSDSYTAFSQRNEVCGSIALEHKKLLNFLATSKEDFLSEDKCYKRVMAIKGLLRATGNYSADQAEQHNWRDVIYDEIVETRKMYSLLLDVYLYELEKKREAGTMDKKDKAHHKYLTRCLQFLSTCRADLVFEMEPYCREWLDSFKPSMMIGVREEDFVKAKQCGRTNWRDSAYEQIQDKADMFMYQVYQVYLAFKVKRSQVNKGGDKIFEQLEKHVKNALAIYQMPRGKMALLVTVVDYFNFLDALKVQVEECVCLIRQLLPEEEGTSEPTPKWDCNPERLIPNRWKLRLLPPAVCSSTSDCPVCRNLSLLS